MLPGEVLHVNANLIRDRHYFLLCVQVRLKLMLVSKVKVSQKNMIKNYV